ncbi:MAG: DJ-1/PfpI family protein [Hyphomonas sp.]|nr:DJ-1/PfpI family protein [Hyphomonas sp.]
MSFRRRILFFLFDGFEILDLSGPASIFNTASAYLPGGGYECLYLSSAGGSLRAGCGVEMATQRAANVRLRSTDTLIAVGGDDRPLGAALKDRVLIAALVRAAARAGRVASVCSGAFLLAEAGLLTGRQVTTHWAGRENLAARYPGVQVNDDALYIRDGTLWTSAGAAAGIDMALAILQHDHGDDLMRSVARRLVVYAHRPGQQSQFSTLIDRQASAPGFSGLIAWLETRLAQPVGVTDMAEQCAMSERSFHRRFTSATGRTPARFLEELRFTHARHMLESGAPVKSVAASVGFRSDSAFRTAFRKSFGVSPSIYRTLHAA